VQSHLDQATAIKGSIDHVTLQDWVYKE